MNKGKKPTLVTSLLLDGIGMATIAIPVIGPFLDLLWAPVAARLMSRMYPGKKGKLASIIVFIEEVLPVTDIVPTFTLMWLYTRVLDSKKETQVVQVKA